MTTGTDKQRKPIEHEIVDHGVVNTQYFQGAGTSYTRWEAAIIGADGTPHDALEDALSQAASDMWDVEGVENKLSIEPDHKHLHYEDCPVYAWAHGTNEEPSTPENEPDCTCEDSDLIHYVVLYLR